MDFKDITLDQAIEIVKVWSRNRPDNYRDVTVRYQPYIHEWYEDARELIIIEFVCPNFFGNSPRDIAIHIDSKLNCFVFYRDMDKESGNMMLKHLGGMSPFPYVALMKSFGLEPREENTTDHDKTPDTTI